MLFQKLSTILTIGVSTLALGACGIGHPNAFPSGYTYHHQEYKSAKPAPSPKVSKEQRSHMDVAQAEQFRKSVYDLLSRMTSRAGMPPKPVYVLAPSPMTPFYAHIDNDLRESMRSIGYAISDRPEGAYVFTYSADIIDTPRTIEELGQSNVELMLKVFNSADPKARQLTQEIGRYYIQGAETLNVHPSVYADLPNYQTIRHQMQGFNTFDSPRTSDGDLNTQLNRGDDQFSTSQIQPTPESVTDFPQPVMIDSSGVSYGGAMNEYSPTMPNARISREIEY